MKLYAPLFVTLLAAPVFAQTTAMDNSDLSSRVGTSFYSDDTMMTLRDTADIQTQWTTISAEDQAAIRARCEVVNAAVDTGASGESTGPATGDGAVADAVPSEGSATTADTGSSDESTGPATGDGAADDATSAEPSTGAEAGATVDSGSSEESTGPATGDGAPATDSAPSTMADANFIDDDVRMQPICAAIQGL
jgi:hypothetical protein